MSIDEKSAMPADKHDGISPAVDAPSDAFEVGEISKVDVKAADPAFALVSGERIEYSEEEGKSVLSKIVSMHL
jgi:ACS family allantoate permease-like MFS transporter